ncbi:unnamed protein product [Ectocarpus sp. 12 AP-2014]
MPNPSPHHDTITSSPHPILSHHDTTASWMTHTRNNDKTVFSARAKKLEYSTGETFWIEADAAPRNCLERLALDIFKAHTAGARFNQKTSGAEWWTQVIEDTDDIGWHWDKDYGMEARGINVHPCLATVTYLSTNGGPTVVLEKKGPMACEDVDEVSGEAAKAWVSRPALGKHICFDGRYLHAAPADLALPPPTTGLDETPPPSLEGGTSSSGGGGGQSEGGLRGGDEAGRSKKRDKDGKSKVVLPGSSVDGKGGSSNTTARRRRVTFLVNVWLNHTPRTAAPLPAPTAAELGPSNLVLRLSPADFVPPTPLLVDETAAPTGPDDDGAMPGQGRRTVATKLMRFGPAKPKPGRQEASVATGSVAAREGEETAAAAAGAVDMKWEFGEVGDEAEKHLRHEVLVPVPIAFLQLPSPACSEGPAAGCASKDESAAGSGDEERVGRSFCVAYEGTRRPRVSRVDLGEEGSEGSGSSGEESEEEEEEEEV